MKKLGLLFYCLVGIVLPKAWAQEFQIKRVELTAETIILHYDLIDTVRSRNYTISVFSSKDNFLSPLQQVSGDAGLEVRPGKDKKITWASKSELGPTFKGDLELEIRGRVYVPFIKFDAFPEGLVFKRGKAKALTWTGGTRQNILNFNIYKDGKPVDVIANIANSGSQEIAIPKGVKTGKGYYFLVSDSKNKDQVMRTPTFQVKPRIPVLVKTAAILIAGYITYNSLHHSNTDLATPPDPNSLITSH